MLLTLRSLVESGASAPRTLTANTGSVAITGSAAGFRVTRNMVVSTGSVAVSGNNAALRATRMLAASTANVAIAGNAAGLYATRSLSAQTASVTIAGNAAAIRATRTLTADTGAVAITGYAAGLTTHQDRLLQANTGSISIAGSDATLRVTRTMTAQTGTIAISGNDAALTAVGRGLTARQAVLLKALANLNGLVAGEPLTVSATARASGGVTQAITQANGVVTLTTTALPAFDNAGVGGLTAEQAGWIEALARIHGLLDPVVVTDATRSDGTLSQTFSQSNGVTTVARA